MKLNKNLMALAIGVTALASTAAPSFAGQLVSNSNEFNVSRGETCTVHITCNRDSEKCTADLSCTTPFDNAELATRVWAGSDTDAKEKNVGYTSKGYINGRTVKAPGEVTKGKGYAKVKVDGEYYSDEVYINVAPGDSN